MPGLADLVNGVNQWVLTIWLESNIEVDSGAVGRLNRADLVIRNGIPLVLYKHIVPRRARGRTPSSSGHQSLVIDVRKTRVPECARRQFLWFESASESSKQGIEGNGRKIEPT